jgi:act minimal PKS acyl carrier protein
LERLVTAFSVTELNTTIAKCLGNDSGGQVTDDNLDTEFSELGYDSLAVYELMTRLQDDIGIPISDEEIDELTTPRLVIAFVNDRQ